MRAKWLEDSHDSIEVWFAYELHLQGGKLLLEKLDYVIQKQLVVAFAISILFCIKIKALEAAVELFSVSLSP